MPEPDAAQRQHQAAVEAALDARLAAAGGWLRFDEYFAQLMYAPGLGYYSAGAAKIGAAGDFTTAPERSPLFGACLARACAPLITGANAGVGGAHGDVLELGAGTGALAESMLLRLATLDALPAHYYILEVSPDLRERQRTRLAALPPAIAARVRWLDALPAAPVAGVILANEVADALPFRCFERTAEGCLERGVARDAAGKLGWATRPADATLAGEVARIEAALAERLPEGHVCEVCPQLDAWVASLAAVLARGLLLLIDYGHGRPELYHPQRSAGTLRCHWRHRAHDDPFVYPGLQDITAWVDFTRIAEAGSDAGLEVAGYCTQAGLLLGSGLDAELAQRAADDAPLGEAAALRAHTQRVAEARALLMPEQMGEVFKAIALVRGVAPPAAFALQDLRRML
jgi:SAM-dependent MidA family methyltransferase